MKINSKKSFYFNGESIKYYSKYKSGKEMRYIFVKMVDEDNPFIELTEKEVKELC